MIENHKSRLNYLKELFNFYFGDLKIQIIDWDKDKYPNLEIMVKNLCKKFQIGKVRVIILEEGFNAHAMSFFGSRIKVSKKLMENLGENELEAVIAHEFSHLYFRHSILALTVLSVFVIPLLALTILTSIFPNNPPLLFLWFLSALALFFSPKIMNWVKLHNEIIADREAALRIENPLFLEKALIKLYIRNPDWTKRPTRLSVISSGLSWIKAYFFGFTHPFLKERIEHIKFANEMRNKNE